MHGLIHLIVFIGFFVLVVFGLQNYLTIDDLAKCETRPHPIDVSCSKAHAIVAVSGGDTRARASEAVELYQAGWADWIIFSGAALDQSGPSNALVMQRQAIDAGVPASRILVEQSSFNTEENAVGVGEIIKARGFKEIILVTSPYHQRRAYLEFKETLPAEIIIVNHPTRSDRMWPNTWWLTPYGWSLALGELAKTSYVHVRSLL